MGLTISTIHYDRVSRHQNLGELRCPSHHGFALSTLYLEKKRNKYFIKSGFIALSGVIYITSSEGKCLLATVMKSYDFPSHFRRVSPFLSFPMRKNKARLAESVRVGGRSSEADWYPNSLVSPGCEEISSGREAAILSG